jgi:alkyldihydroxyacetonephosphate synthase
MKNNKTFIPDWIDKAPVENSFRSIFKYGNPNGFKHPSKRLYEELKRVFDLTDNDFKQKISTGNEKVDFKRKPSIEVKHIEFFKKLCGKENVSFSEYQRLKYSTGKTMEEALLLRQGQVKEISDLVVHPRNKNEIVEIVTYCNENLIPVNVYGGGSSVNLGFYPEKRGITLVLSTHMNKILNLNEQNQTARVQAGILGPDFEKALNNAPEIFGTSKKFTCGHFPQSFEYSSVGAWFVTFGSGQESSYYGDAADFVLAVEVVTPSGVIKTHDFPAEATGPRILDFFKGNEGIFGIVTELTWKLHRYMPQNRQSFGFIFPDWKAAVDAAREISQAQFGMPAVFRISDPEETHHGLKLYGIEGSIFDKIMTAKGFKPMQRCLFIGTAEGEKKFAKNIKRNVKKIARKYGAMYLTSFPVKKWQPGRYTDPYLREDLADYGIIIDTLETSVNWDNLLFIHQKVRDFVKNRPKTIAMTHSSHFYAQGTNLYFIFLIKENNIEKYLKFQRGVINAIYEAGGSLSHHHGIGRMIKPWMPKYHSEEELLAIKALKNYFDPNNIMNPGNLI